jgi:hypothetical protein
VQTPAYGGDDHRPDAPAGQLSELQHGCLQQLGVHQVLPAVGQPQHGDLPTDRRSPLFLWDDLYRGWVEAASTGPGRVQDDCH